MGQAAKTKEKTWYDYPQYYEMGFRDQNRQEANFFEEVFKKFVPGKVKHLLEPGCGSGRLVFEMAKRGFKVTGLDLNQRALDYAQKRLEKNGLKANLLLEDMTNFQLDRKFDAAFNTINTFRHLLTEEDAVKHLQLIAAHLRVGGVYILGLHVFPPGSDLMGTERWKAQTRTSKIVYSLTVLEASLRTRLERLKMTMTVQTPTKKFRVYDELQLRLYNADQIKSLFEKVPEFKLVEVFDFWYDIEGARPIDDELADAIFLLQKQ